jgi:hypothetical protein
VVLPHFLQATFLHMVVLLMGWVVRVERGRVDEQVR